MFKIHSKFKPTGDQPKAIDDLVEGIQEGKKHQVLLGATGTGKTFTMANVIERVNKPKNSSQKMQYVTLFLIMITINQKHMYHQQIHILKKTHQ